MATDTPKLYRVPIVEIDRDCYALKDIQHETFASPHEADMYCQRLNWTGEVYFADHRKGVWVERESR